ncbi:MAG: T9SS type A sorting domain-containing protein [Bacteroidales bacterium]|nr:T9SS type A sorting domain-containing protein [Bacteroidales bacterium]
MKALICINLTFLILHFSHAQTEFQKHFDFSSFDVLSNLIQTNDGNLLLCGHTSYGILVIKTDLYGEVIWQKDFDWTENAKAFDICETPNSDLYLGGSFNNNHGFVMRLNEDGDSITSKAYSSDTYVYANACAGSEVLISRQYHIPGQNAGGTAIFSVDSMLNTFNSYGDYDFSMIHTISVANAYWYFVGYHTWDNKTFIRKNNTWYNEYNGSDPLDLIVADDNNIYFSRYSSYSLVKTNDSGDIVWTSGIFSSGHYINSMQFYYNKLIVTGSLASKYYFSIVDTTDGAVDTTFLFNNDYCTSFGAGMVVNGNDLYIAGHFKETDSIDDFDIFLNKYSLDTILTEIIANNNDFIEFNCYPNPSNSDYITIEVQEANYYHNLQIKFYDITGRLVQEQKLIQNHITNIVDISEWKKGIYMAILYNDSSAKGQMKIIIH